MDIDSWPHYWFGFWKEDGHDECPSVHDFILPDRQQPADIEHVLTYLTEAFAFAFVGNFRDPVTGERQLASLGYRTDGEWQWRDSLAYLVKRYGLSLPPGLIETARSHQYKAPHVSIEQARNMLVPPDCQLTWAQFKDGSNA